MGYDETFPNYASSMIRATSLLAAIATVVCFFIWDWDEALGVITGAGFQVTFLWFLRKKYIKWSKAGRDPESIGRRLVGYTGARLFIQIGACVLFALCLREAVWGFLIGLLSLTVASFVDKIIDVIKE